MGNFDGMGLINASASPGYVKPTYGRYVGWALYSIRLKNPALSKKQACLKFLENAGLADTIKIDDVLAISEDRALPSPPLQMVFDELICSNVEGVEYDEVKLAYNQAAAFARTFKGRMVGEELTPQQCLKATFRLARTHRELNQADVAKTLGVTQKNISCAEDPTESLWPSFYESRDVAMAYAGQNTKSAVRLEAAAHQCIFPEGISNLEDLTKCIARKFFKSIDALGSEIGVDHLQAKVKATNHTSLSIRDQVALRSVLATYLQQVDHLNLGEEILDTTLPNPFKGKQFSELLVNWAELACGTREKFVESVGVRKDRTFNSKAWYQWQRGTGLAPNLDDIVAVIEEQPISCKLFKIYKEEFLLNARKTLAAMPSRQNSHLDRLRHQPREDSLGLGQRGVGR